MGCFTKAWMTIFGHVSALRRGRRRHFYFYRYRCLEIRSWLPSRINLRNNMLPLPSWHLLSATLQDLPQQGKWQRPVSFSFAIQFFPVSRQGQGCDHIQRYICIGDLCLCFFTQVRHSIVLHSTPTLRDARFSSIVHPPI